MANITPGENQRQPDHGDEKTGYWESLLDNAAAPAIVWDTDFIITRFNHAFERLTGQNAADVLGKRIDVLIPPEKRDSALREIRRAASRGQGWESEEVQIQHADGSVRTVLWSAAVISAADGQTPAATIAQGLDITERKKVERLKDDFIGMVSHELRTPLTVVTSAINTALDERISPQELRQLLAAADSSAASLGSILDNLLELARYRAERLTLDKKLADVPEIIGQTVAKVHRQYPARHAAVDIPDNLPPALIDSTRLERVIYNLVENAFKYSPRDSEVKVSARQEKDNLLISVSDRGKGMSPEDIKKLFEPFERANATRGTRGMGLGLLVCKHLVEAHGGKIWVESAPGAGTTFLFTIPREKQERHQR
ncbi:MAG: ATP-binding protein [Dehalococcoidales bacterium]|jgi:PAS domain S-box-containing protein